MNAKIVELRTDRIQAALDDGMVPVIGGAQGVSTDKDVTFLGRGGSDTTAVALAGALNADYCELYTDVSGVFSADPRLIPNARRMHHITFDELLEMCATGCPKPAMRSVEYAKIHGVKLHVRSAFTWETGTIVSEFDPQEGSVEQAIVSAVTSDTSEAKLTIEGVPDRPGIAATLFRRLADALINVDMIVQNVSDQGVTDISFTVPHEHAEGAERITSALGSEIDAAEVSVDHDIARVSLVGAGMKSNPGVAATMFETLAANDINIAMISTSAIRTSCVVEEARVEDAVRVLHTAFGLDV